jgi:hypothetical protein
MADDMDVVPAQRIEKPRGVGDQQRHPVVLDVQGPRVR